MLRDWHGAVALPRLHADLPRRRCLPVPVLLVALEPAPLEVNLFRHARRVRAVALEADEDEELAHGADHDLLELVVGAAGPDELAVVGAGLVELHGQPREIQPTIGSAAVSCVMSRVTRRTAFWLLTSIVTSSTSAKLSTRPTSPSPPSRGSWPSRPKTTRSPGAAS